MFAERIWETLPALMDLPPRLLLGVEGPRVRLPGWVVVAVVVEVAVRDD